MHKINGELTLDKGNKKLCPLCYEELFTNYPLSDVIVIQCFEKNLVVLMLEPEDPEVAEVPVIMCKPITREQEEELVKGCKEGFYELFDMDGNKFTKLDFGREFVNKKGKKLIKIRNKLNKTSIYLPAFRWILKQERNFPLTDKNSSYLDKQQYRKSHGSQQCGAGKS